MSHEGDVATVLRADAELVAILTGGIYTEEEIGIQGIRRGADSPTNDAFDAEGVLKPTAVVREGAEVGYSTIRSVKDKIAGVTQPIEIYFYQHRDKASIFLAKQRVFELLENRRLSGTYPLIWMGETPVYYDVGPLANSTTVRQDWRCVYLRRS